MGHIDLANSVSVLSAPTICDAFAPDQTSFQDFDFHGTFVSGQIVGGGIGISGIAPDSRVVGVKVLSCLGSGTFGDVITGIVYAADTRRFRTSRAAGENIIPTDTNSADIITRALPAMKGKISVTSLNVPVTDGSNIDMVAQISGSTTREAVNEAMRSAIDTQYAGIIEYVDDPIVSSDVRLDPHSGVYDSLATMVTGGTLVKTITWFNNGWGYSHRALEHLRRLGVDESQWLWPRRQCPGEVRHE